MASTTNLPTSSNPSALLEKYFVAMLQELGPQNWWPARAPLEIILGAILVQNTSWQNAALALKQMRKSGLLALKGLQRASRAELESGIRSSGFFRQKARTISEFLAWLARARRGSLARMFATPAQALRAELLEVGGLGPETVDAILLYAGRQPFFPADAYTRRILARHGLVPRSGTSYSSVQKFLHQHLPADPALFNEYHALLVQVGKRYCKKQAAFCKGCPLEEFLPRATIAVFPKARTVRRGIESPAG